MSAFDTAVHTIQFLAADAVEKAASGHPGTPMALAGITTELFSNAMRYQPQDPAWPNRDRFVLSCGHASMLLYSVAHLAGFDVPKEQLTQFRQWESLTPGHPEYGHTAGVETTTGPLGQGISNAVGLALGAKLAGARVNKPDCTLIDYKVYVLASDGDLMEGVASESCSLAGQWGLGNLIVIYDANNITIDGKAELSFSEDVGKRFEAYGWGVAHVDGHAPAEVRAAIEAARRDESRPSLIVARTHIGIGCPTKQDSPKAHGSPLGKDEIRGAKQAAGWPAEPDFYTPAEAYTPFKEHVARVRPEYDAWQERMAKLSAEQRAAYDAVFKVAPKDLLTALTAKADTKTDATRSSGGKMLQFASELVSNLISGAADLAASTKTDLAGTTFVSKGSFGGRNLRFGVREHGMGSIANGLALAGFTPVTSTFLIFSDYMRPPIRLASMMKIQSIYVFTHDSFHVGEDGPTHQPIEQTSSLRLIPGLDVFRPADSLECAAAWALALERKDGPSALLLTRQNLPAIQRGASFKNEDLRQGAYIVSDATDPTLVLIASGSELSLAVDAKVMLEKKGQRVRVVSALCLERFLRQPREVQQRVLGTARRISIEAGATALWRGLVGLDGIAIGLDHFGASAPAEILAEKFGFTAQAVTDRVLSAIAG
jgi:transketolase